MANTNIPAAETLEWEEVQESTEKLPPLPPIHQPSTRTLAWGHVKSLLLAIARFVIQNYHLAFILSFLWHIKATRLYIWHPHGTFHRYLTRPVSKPVLDSTIPSVAADVLRLAGGLNAALAVLCLAGLRTQDINAKKLILFVLSVANASQVWFNAVHYLKTKRWNWTFLKEQIGGDLVVAGMNIVAYGRIAQMTNSLL
ncbi:hypothetical protein BZG36_01744 [Bifiguratus adelaidae]|uniref:Uncharacterized protein n=1 Tax=Bifiguratus adelaidae TaxID=1938954 RepID=A0A261Y324_9FUNG|nr:hypothetical protein BZG36_01744 [Bifiguratus adelaidae]